MTPTDLFPGELASVRRAGATLIDVREPDEYTQGHVPGAINLPLSALPGREAEVPDGAVLICAGGHRSSQAATHLARQGRTGLRNLLGGTAAWRREGREVHTGDRP